MRKIPFGKPIIGEAEKQDVCAVMESGIMAHGPKIHEFEEAFAKFTGAPHVVGVSSCTAAMHLFYFHLGLGPGDEVIVPAQTHVATAHSVELTGAKPVFVDVSPDTGNISPALVKAALTEKTRAISLVHYLGMPAEMKKINALAAENNLQVVEDCALSIGGKIGEVHTGLLGDVGAFSFYPVKHMTTAEGGVLITRHQDIADSITRLRAFGMDRHVGIRKVPGLYDVEALGFNYRMNELQAAMGVQQVKRLPGFLEKRLENHGRFAELLADMDELTLLQPRHQTGRYQSACYCHVALLNGRLAEKRNDVILALKEKGIGTSIYYPRPVPLMTYYKEKYGYNEKDFPEASKISNTGIALPVGPHLEIEDIGTIARELKNTIRQMRNS